MAVAFAGRTCRGYDVSIQSLLMRYMLVVSIYVQEFAINIVVQTYVLFKKNLSFFVGLFGDYDLCSYKDV